VPGAAVTAEFFTFSRKFLPLLPMSCLLLE